jgi:hypothetical protein
LCVRVIPSSFCWHGLYSQPRHTHTHTSLVNAVHSFPYRQRERRRIIKSHTRATLFMISNWLERAGEERHTKVVR